jgi:hypothetical protein
LLGVILAMSAKSQNASDREFKRGRIALLRNKSPPAHFLSSVSSHSFVALISHNVS